MTPIETLLAYSAALDRGDLTAMAALLDDAFQLDGAGFAGIDKTEFLAAMQAQLDAFTGYSENPTDLRAEADIVQFTAHVTGRHTGTLVLPGIAPVPPTGRSIALPPEPAWVQVQGGRLVRYHVDPVEGGGIQGVLAQLGVS